MKLGLGIDTGGTCTDAVLYDFTEKKIIATSKATTTKEDLSIGILQAIDSLPSNLLKNIERVALSTTLATNACVENKGGRAKLLMVNAYRKIVAEAGHLYGLPEYEDIRFVDAHLPENTKKAEDAISAIDETDLLLEVSRNNETEYDEERSAEELDRDFQEKQHSLGNNSGHTSSIEIKTEINDKFNLFFQDNLDWFKDADALGIVELNASLNGAVIEKNAKSLFEATGSIPAIGSYELFSDPNVLQRGAGTLLNARLIPVIGGFLASVKKAMTERGITAPVVIVRSDGSLMSETFTSVRPVETLLCGPAASVMGGMALSGAQDSIIVDMGGTTTDMAIIKDGLPIKADDGIRIGKWKTYVKGVYIDTFGLGGDSAIRHTLHGHLHIDTMRVFPLSMAADRYPEVVTKLQALLSTKYRHTLPLHEFYMLVRDMSKIPDIYAKYTTKEIAFCKALEKGPLIWSEAAASIGLDIYNLNMTRLEQEGIVIRCGLTPTDLMHVRGEFTKYNTEAAVLGLRFVAASVDMEEEQLVEHVYNRMKKTLYVHIVRLLLEENDPHYRKNGLGAGLERLIESRWDSISRFQEKTWKPVKSSNPLTEWQKAKTETKIIRNEGLLDIRFHTSSVLVAIGAPTHIFLPDVAKALGTTCIMPEHAGVANALGAILGHIAAEISVEIRLEGGPGGISGYRVRGFTESKLFESRENAIQYALEDAEKEAKEEAVRRGAIGELTVTSGINSQSAEARGGASIELGITVTATAVGGGGI